MKVCKKCKYRIPENEFKMWDGECGQCGSTNKIKVKEIHKKIVKPIAKTGYIPFLKQYLGRVVFVALPRYN